jgi:hypothetical protein
VKVLWESETRLPLPLVFTITIHRGGYSPHRTKGQGGCRKGTGCFHEKKGRPRSLGSPETPILCFLKPDIYFNSPNSLAFTAACARPLTSSFV